MLQAKIERAVFAANSCIEIGRGCQKHFRIHMAESNCRPVACRECIDLIETYGADMSQQLQRLQCLERRSQDICNLVCLFLDIRLKGLSLRRLICLEISKVLLFRNEVLLQDCNRQSSDTLSNLLTISERSGIHQETLTQLFGTVRADSVLLKAFSIMATAYLPATLIAVSRSRNHSLAR